MTRLTALIVGVACALTAGVLVATASYAGQPLPLDPQPACPPESCTSTWVTAPRQVLDVSRDRQALKVVTVGGGCLLDTPRFEISETASNITLSVRLEQRTPANPTDPAFVCTADRQYLVSWIRLKSVIGGRRIDGGPSVDEEMFNRTKEVDGRIVPLVPRVLGLMGQDAVTVLRSQGFRVRLVGSRSGRVFAQSRRPGSGAPRGLVRLRTVGPDLLPEP